MKKTSLLIITALAVAQSASAAVFALSGNMDILQAGTNGGFGGGTGNGTGTIAGSYDDVTNVVNYTLTWQNISGPVTNMHFHLGAPGVSGGVELSIPGPWASPYTNTSAPISAAAEINLLAGDWYVNVHTGAFGGGEIRGQVNVAPIPEPTTGLLALTALAGFLGRRRR